MINNGQVDITLFQCGPRRPTPGLPGSTLVEGSWGREYHLEEGTCNLRGTSLSEAPQTASSQSTEGKRHFIKKALAEPLPGGACPRASR